MYKKYDTADFFRRYVPQECIDAIWKRYQMGWNQSEIVRDLEIKPNYVIKILKYNIRKAGTRKDNQKLMPIPKPEKFGETPVKRRNVQPFQLRKGKKYIEKTEPPRYRYSGYDPETQQLVFDVLKKVEEPKFYVDVSNYSQQKIEHTIKIQEQIRAIQDQNQGKVNVKYIIKLT